jgi:hypothetical protein
MTSMRFGRVNVVAGAAGLLLAGLGGVALGLTFDTYSVKDGSHLLSIVRFYLREGHSHGMPIALFNLVVGSLVDRLGLSDRSKRLCSIAAMVGLVLPLGLALKGASGARSSFPPIGLIGVLGLLTSACLLLVGALRMRSEADGQ